MSRTRCAVGGPVALLASVLLLLAPQMASGVTNGEVTATQLKQILEEQKSSVVMVEFYAPWCKHCKELAPTWDRLARTYDKQAFVLKIDATQGDVGSTYGVSSYPTIKSFREGASTSYSGARDLSTLVAWVNKETGLSVPVPESGTKEITVPELQSEIASLKENPQQCLVVKFYAPWCGHCKSLAPTWDELTDFYASEDNVSILKLDADKDKRAGGIFGAKGFPTLKLFKGDAVELYAGERSLPDLVSWVNEQCGTKVEVPESWKPKKAKLDVDPEQYEDMKKFALFQSSMSHFQYAEADERADGVRNGQYNRAVDKHVNMYKKTQEGISITSTNMDLDKLNSLARPLHGSGKLVDPTASFTMIAHVPLANGRARSQMANVEALAKKYKDSNARFIAITPDEEGPNTVVNPSDIKKFSHVNILAVKTGVTSILTKIYPSDKLQMQEVFIVRGDGRILWIGHTGFINPETSMVEGDEDIDLGLDCVGSLLKILEKFPEFDGTNPPTTKELEEAVPQTKEAAKGKDEL